MYISDMYIYVENKIFTFIINFYLYKYILNIETGSRFDLGPYIISLCYLTIYLYYDPSHILYVLYRLMQLLFINRYFDYNYTI